MSSKRTEIPGTYHLKILWRHLRFIIKPQPTVLAYWLQRGWAQWLWEEGRIAGAGHDFLTLLEMKVAGCAFWRVLEVAPCGE